jgi:hypothetical protein
MRSASRWAVAAVLVVLPLVATLPITIAGNEQANGGCIGCGMLDIAALAAGAFLARAWMRRSAR